MDKLVGTNRKRKQQQQQDFGCITLEAKLKRNIEYIQTKKIIRIFFFGNCTLWQIRE